MSSNHNLFVALRRSFPRDLDQVAIETADGRSYSWRHLDEQSAQIANLLASLRIEPDPDAPPRIAVQVDKSVESLILYLASLRAGFVFLPLNTAYQGAEIAYFAQDAAAAVVVCASRQLERIEPIARQGGAAHVFTLDADRSGSLLDRAAAFGAQQNPVERSAADPAAILYTSGTTGRSKGALLTHGNLLASARTLRDYWGWQTSEPGGQAGADVLIHALPTFHAHGLFVAANGALLAGCRMLWHAKFDARAVVADLGRATLFMGVPTMYVRMLNEPTLTREQVAGMRLFICGSAPLSMETFDAWRARTGHSILERYGMSETVLLTSNPYRPDPRFRDQDERRGGTVGFPLPGVDLRLRDEHGQPVATGEVGGIQVKGDTVFPGYWRMPEKTREEFTADGYFVTGDVGRQDERGYVTIVGRSKDLIISGGYNVYPAEIEAYLNDMPGVAESALVGVPHPDFGEVGIAVIVTEPGAQVDGEAMIDELKTRLANFKVPKRCFVELELPRNAMGKVQKNLLRAKYEGIFAQV